MKQIGVFYGSSTGTTEDIAKSIFNKLGDKKKELLNVGLATKDDLERFDILILGSSTWGDGELQSDWEPFLKNLEDADLKDKKIALFGCGDSMGHADTFCDAIGIIYNSIKEKGAKIIGSVKIDDYDFDESSAIVNNNFVGLALDEDNEDNKTEERINEWIKDIKNHF